MKRVDREETIGEVLEIIAQIDNLPDMRDKILRLATRLKAQYPIIYILPKINQK